VTFLTFLYTHSFLIGSSHMEKHRIKIRCLLAQETEIKLRMYNMQTVLFNLTNIVDIPHSDTLNSPSECNQS
jgi:hypothetical protein